MSVDEEYGVGCLPLSTTGQVRIPGILSDGGGDHPCIGMGHGTGNLFSTEVPFRRVGNLCSGSTEVRLAMLAAKI